MKTFPQRKYARAIYRSPLSVFLRRLGGCAIIAAALPFAFASAREEYGPAALVLLGVSLLVFCVGQYFFLTARRDDQ